MKTFVSSCAVIIIAILIVEIFCPAKVMKKSLYMAFSLAMLVVLVGGIRNLLSAETSGVISDINFRVELSKDSILNESANLMEEQIVKALEESDIRVSDVTLDYYINELSLVFEYVTVEIEEETKKDKAVEIVKNITGLSEKEIDVWVSS